MSNILIACDSDPYKEIKTFIFPGGEVSVNIKNPHIAGRHVFIKAYITNSDDLISLALVKNAVDNKYPSKVTLILLYVPYARQDRVCSAGESLSIKVFADILNNLNFYKVVIADPHSDVTPAL